MPLLPKWQEIVRQTHLDEGVVLRRAIREHIKAMRMIGDNEHIRNPGDFLALMAALGSTIGQAEALSRKSNDILENNGKPTSDDERRAFVKAEQERGKGYRMKRGV